MAADFENYPNISNPECFWTPVREWGGLPNVKWCEETLCGVIAEPSNTWSNLAYLVTAAFLFWKTRGETSRTLRFWPHAAFWVGLTSLVYHASVTFVLQVFDFFGMYFFFNLVLLLNLVRWGKLKKESFFVVLFGSIIALTAFTVAVAKTAFPIQGIVAVLLVSTLVTEALASRSGAAPARWGPLVLCLAFIAAAGTFSGLDASRAWCHRENLVLHGHAIWHVLGAISMTFAYFHYRQFAARFV